MLFCEVELFRLMSNLTRSRSIQRRIFGWKQFQTPLQQESTDQSVESINPDVQPQKY